MYQSIWFRHTSEFWAEWDNQFNRNKHRTDCQSTNHNNPSFSFPLALRADSDFLQNRRSVKVNIFKSTDVENLKLKSGSTRNTASQPASVGQEKMVSRQR